MRMKPMLSLSLATVIPLLVGCGVSATDEGTGNVIQVPVKVSYNRPVMGPGGLSGSETRPGRYLEVSVYNSSNQKVDEFLLDGNGQGVALIPEGIRATVVAWAAVQVPFADNKVHTGQGDRQFWGSVRNLPSVTGGGIPTKGDWQGWAFKDAADFEGASQVYADYSQPFVAQRGVQVDINTPANVDAAKAFSIADSMVSYVIGVDQIQADLSFPSLHAFWRPGVTWEGVPRAIRTSSGAVVKDMPYFNNGVTASRNAFQFVVPGTAADAFNPTGLVATELRQLFAPDSVVPQKVGFPVNGTTQASLLRHDNDNEPVSWNQASDPAAAFVSGFTDFLSAAILQRNTVQAVKADGTVDTLVLDRSGVGGTTGEFYRDSIAGGLYKAWKGSYQGTVSGLGTLWDAAFNPPTTPDLNYLDGPLASLPTYAVGLRADVSSSTWTGISQSLAAEGIGDVTSSYYLTGEAIWSMVPSLPYNCMGTLRTYPAASGIYYDANQSRAWRFVQTFNGARTFTLTTPSNQDLWLEVIGKGGVVAASTAPSGSTTRTLSLNLPAGNYVARVRVGNTTANATVNYTLNIQ